MKRVVNGVESEIESIGDVSAGADRLWVETDAGKMSAVAVRQGDAVLVSFGGRQFVVEKSGASRRGGGGVASGTFVAPMPGLIVDVFIAVGETVKKGQKMVVLEAMKTQQPCVAAFEGVVRELPVSKGQQVNEGQMLVRIEAVDA